MTDDRPTTDAAPFSRRDALRTALPAAAFAGAALAGAGGVFGQAAPMGQRPSDAGQPDEGKGPRESVIEELVEAAYKDGAYALPPLPYDYDALEPHIDAQTMRLHHDKHHQGYVDGLNSALKAVKSMLDGGGEIDMAKLAGVERNVSFNAGGHLLHTVFWGAMSPDGGGEPAGAIGRKIGQQFGSFANFRKYYSAVAAGVKGSGWAILQYEPVGDNLVVAQVNEHDAHLPVAATPLLPIDVWEHAYYLKYQNDRKAYIDAWFNTVNWPEVDRVYTYTLGLYGRDPEMPAAS